ncbi:hypothetical protein NX794_03630 [Streptomyces sp. LP11]|uniref:Uncharacterized protein n=1 Tax=Streptomyces pyxinicus TaxID=2970331 RepID=A0ABT2AVQ1_9ACTN|nr:hypothetical protein [Streptomyces sp. LP11]MCS0600324.1 hypothetical protein [Streptomyces sp. LP11]
MTNNIAVADATFAQVNLLARAWGVSPGQAVTRLVEHFQLPDAARITEPRGERVAVHAIYNSERFEGEYDPVTQALSVTSGKAAGNYRTPSGAASAVLQAANPDVKPNRNGWGFWTVSETGKLLQSLR